MKSSLTVHLISKRRSQWPWGLGNPVYRYLRKLGCKVIDIDYLDDPPSYLSELLSLESNLVIVIKGGKSFLELIEKIESPCVLWYTPDFFAFPPARPYLSYVGYAYDRIYIPDKIAIPELMTLGAKDVRWLPFGCDPIIHKKLALPKIYDLSFVGNLHPNRISLFSRLQRKFNLFIGVGMYMLEMVKVFNQSKIVLNLGMGRTCYNQRVFEALGCGSFLLTNEIPMDSRIFEDKKHLVYFNEENIEEIIEYYLAHDIEREEIAAYGHKEVVENHTYYHRVRKILEDSGYA